jgi:hypothetical protein
MTKVRDFVRHFPRFKRQAVAGKPVLLVDRQGQRFKFAADKQAGHCGAGQHLAQGPPLGPEPVPRSEWKGLY